MLKISEPGTYTMPDAEYQQDCCEEISLRSSDAWELVRKGGCPAKAAWQNPRLNPLYVREPKRHFDIGSAAHALLFGKGKEIAIIEGSDYSRNERDGMTKSEKCELRDAAYAAGQVPLLIPELKRVQAMTTAALVQIEKLIDAGTIEANPFNRTESEQVLVARVHGVLCRVACDGLSLDGDVLSEYKTEGQSAAPDAWMWKARKLGYIFRLAFYRKVMEELKIAFSPRVQIFVQETEPPYLLALYRVDDEFLMQEDRRVREALKIWKRCLECNEWPGYSTAGFDLGLTEREEMALHGDPKQNGAVGGHLSSDDIAASL